MKKVCGILSVVLIGLQLITILTSWIVTAVAPSYPMRSLISAGGLRWFMGSFADYMASTLLVYIILISISYSAFINSGITKALSNWSSISMQQQFAIRIVVVELLLFAVGVVGVTATPHAVLLSVTGDLYPSSFSRGLVPFLCFVVFAISMTFSIIGGTVNSLESLWDCMTAKADFLLPSCFIYILALQLYCSLNYVLG